MRTFFAYLYQCESYLRGAYEVLDAVITTGEMPEQKSRPAGKLYPQLV